ncbi:C39 family peptidase [Caldibacillus lycopersici]|uniref:C39 family peptidase n=1 Tax=Perspicuibacillus lycopersici TaxID=1325689 RepID=A0AAE3IQD3_9BACI|nr:C39 family peptidase [Perspicuibacillus lycopersici]MCU9612272.1 C39 family peptidase [Perspicuibacillus lycopersici]
MKICCATFLFISLLGCSNLNSSVPQKTKTDVPIEKQTEYSPTKINGNQIEESSTKGARKKQLSNEKILLDVPLIKQLPELRYGCEVTSTAMLLQFEGVNVSKMDLYQAVKKDPDPLIKRADNILHWGNPDDGFVGDMTGKNRRAGYAVFDKPIVDLVNKYLPGQAVNLTNKSFDTILNHVSDGYPVVVWTTGDYKLPDRWEQWEHKGKLIKTPLDLHCVVLVGFDENNVYLNDPLSGRKNAKVSKEQFIQSWEALKKRAVSYVSYT